MSGFSAHLNGWGYDKAGTEVNQRRPLNIDCHITDQKMQFSTAEQVNRLNEDRDCFHLAVLPQPRLFIIGAVHISQHLAPMAAVGFDVTVIDPRETFAHQARFPDITIIADWPEEALKDIVIDRDTACVTLTHDPKIDDEALKLILAAQPFMWRVQLEKPCGETRTPVTIWFEIIL